MVRWKTGQKDATRRRILDAAGRLFRECGYSNTGVADVMKLAGLTVGGFYVHFESKEDLLSEVLVDAFERTREGLLLGVEEEVEGPAFVREVAFRYLSRFHRDHVAEGCVLPALAAEVGREGAAPREEIERYLLRMIGLLTERAPDSPRHDLSSEQFAFALTALSVGGILLARAVRDPKTSTAILQACRRFAVPETSHEN